jgi:hypothetical protein
VQSLADLMSSPAGLSFLESAGVLVSGQQFKEQLGAPVKAYLAGLLDAEGTCLVCSGQQVYVDYQASVLSKLQVLRDLGRDPTIFPFFLWVDTDRSGSDNLASKFAWPAPSKKGAITILPPGTRDVELRFAGLDAAQLSSAIDKLETHLRQSGEKRPGAKERYLRLRAFFTDPSAATLSEFNLRLSEFLLAQVLDFTPRSLLLSELLAAPEVWEHVDGALNDLAGVVRVFNEARQSLVGRDIDPQVGPLDEHYLPLFYSCDTDATRLRLYHQIDRGDHFAAADCKCGRSYRFYLGNGRLSVAEVARSGRWSLDVCFPIFLNDFVSGYVAGKSSALYLIVLNQVLRQVLAKTPVPILVPESLGHGAPRPAGADSLLYHYFAGS